MDVFFTVLVIGAVVVLVVAGVFLKRKEKDGLDGEKARQG